MAILVKAIKPARLKVDAMRLALLNELRSIGKEIKKDFELTTRSWEGEKPIFEIDISLKQPGPTVFVGPKEDGSKGFLKYLWTDQGTKAHPIFAGIYTGKSNKRVLSFPSRAGFISKTLPGVIGSRAGGSSGPMEKLAYVNHPGTKPRNFDKAIYRLWLPKFKRRMEAAMAKAAKASGHKI